MLYRSANKLKRRTAVSAALLLIIGLLTPLLASAASLFHVTYDPVSGLVYGYVYSDKPTISLSVNDDTYGTRSVVSGKASTEPVGNSYFFDLNGEGGAGLAGLKPVTAVVYEGGDAVNSTTSDVQSSVYSYGNAYKLKPPTGLKGEFSHGFWVYSWDEGQQPLELGFNIYIDGKKLGVYTETPYDTTGRYTDIHQWYHEYEIGGKPFNIQISNVDVAGNESALSDTLTLTPSSEFDGYKFQGNFMSNGSPLVGTTFKIKNNKTGQYEYELAYHGDILSGTTSVGHYRIATVEYSDPDWNYLDYYFDLPSSDYTIEVVKPDEPTVYEILGKEPNPKITAYSEYDGKYINLGYNSTTTYGSFGGSPSFRFQDKYAGQWLKANDEIVRFTPSKNRGKFLTVQLPYDDWPYQGIPSQYNTTTLDSGKIAASDFKLIRLSNQSEVPINEVFLPGSEERPKISFSLAEGLLPGEQYALKLSSASAGNEIRLPLWSGDQFSAGLFTMIKSYDSDITPLLVDSYGFTRSIVIGKAPVSPAAPGITGGGGGCCASSSSVSDTDNGVAIPKDSLKITKEKGASGKEVANVKLDAEQVSKAFEGVKGKDKQHKVITLDAAGSDGGSKIDLPAAALKSSIDSEPNAVLAIQSDAGTYNVPASVLKEAIGKLSADQKDAKVTISIAKVAEQANDVLRQANPSVKPLLANPIEFTITLETAAGVKTEVSDFSGTYVERKIIVSGTVDASKTTVVTFDPATGKMSFIPSVITQRDGKAEVTFKSSHNSVYTVVESAKTFEDVQDHWAQADIELLASKFVVQGMSETTFGPDEKVTRAQFAAMLVKALGLNEAAGAAAFADVAQGDWYAGAVGAAAKLGLIEGVDAEHFAPDADITREQMAVMLSRAIKLSGKSASSVKKDELLDRFADRGDISAWAEAAVGQAVQAGIVNGVTEQAFAPQESATRAQSTVMLKRFLKYVQFIN